MIVLQTNASFGLFESAPEPKGLDWVASLPGGELFTRVILGGARLLSLFCIYEWCRRYGLPGLP
mgnify:CR=1 FL=1